MIHVKNHIFVHKSNHNIFYNKEYSACILIYLFNPLTIKIAIWHFELITNRGMDRTMS